MTGPLLKEREVCRLLGVDRKELYRLRTTRQLAYVPMGKRGVRYRQEDVDAYVARVAQPAQTPGLRRIK